MADDPVVIVGAGPVGLTLALGLARVGVSLVVLEAGSDLSAESRASTFHPPSLEMLDQLDIAKPLMDIGLVAESFQFRDRHAGVVAEFPLRLLSEETPFPFRVQCEQGKLTRLILPVLLGYPDVTVRFDSPVDDVDVSGPRPVVHVGPEVFPASYVVGADGASSTVRKAAGIPFPGKTYEERYVVFSTTANFAELIPGIAPVNYIADPEEWLVLLRTPDHWRAMFPVRDLRASTADVANPAVAQAKLQKLLPLEEAYPVSHCALYSVHLRVAPVFHRGRIVLAGDAAHINNPIGGFGMNSGIHDAFALAQTLPPMLESGHDDARLDAYSVARRSVAATTIARQSDENWSRLRERDPRRRDRQREQMRALASDPDAARAYLRRACMLDPSPYLPSDPHP
ncbi:MAG: FAD-dependent oxidoreductase [Acidimicrobiales bacterium]